MKAAAEKIALDARRMRVAVVGARFNAAIVDALVTCAFELPLAARELARSGRVDGIVALGAVIRGETPHFDFVSGECARGLNDVQMQTGVPVGFGVITADTHAQALARAGGAAGNKGEEAALAVVEMVSLLRELRG
jgi:6,7-dimethyl-8-ribityllumazine synthase